MLIVGTQKNRYFVFVLICSSLLVPYLMHLSIKFEIYLFVKISNLVPYVNFMCDRFSWRSLLFRFIIFCRQHLGVNMVLTLGVHLFATIRLMVSSYATHSECVIKYTSSLVCELCNTLL